MQVVAGLAPAPPAVEVHMLPEAPPPYLGLVLRPCLDLGVSVYPKLRLCLQVRVRHLASEPSCERVKQVRFPETNKTHAAQKRNKRRNFPKDIL